MTPEQTRSRPQPTLTLLALTVEATAAQQLVTALRERGLAVRALITSRTDRLKDLLTRRAFDIILWWTPGWGDEDVHDIEQALAARSDRTGDHPLLVVGSPQDQDLEFARAQRIRARDLVWGEDSARLAWVVEREATDLRQRRRLHELGVRLLQCERRALELMEHTQHPVLLLRELKSLYVNRAYVRLFGFSSEQDAMQTPFLDLVEGQQREALIQLLRTADRTDQTEPVRARLRLFRDGTIAHGLEAQVSVVRIPFDGGLCLRLIIEHDTSGARPLAGRAIEAQPGSAASEHARLLAEIESRIAADRSVAHPFVIFFVRLVRVSDLLRDLGLTHGLRLIDTLGERLTALVDVPHVLARVSDEGFGLLIDETDETSANALAERIRGGLRLPEHDRIDSDLEADCEVGYYRVRDQAAAAEDLLNAAHRLSVYIGAEPIDTASNLLVPTSLAARARQETVEGDLEVIETLRAAFDTGRFRLVYQPIISLMGDSQENYSVLVRLEGTDGELLPAREFIGPAIRGGLIQDIDRWTIRESIRVLGEQRRQGHHPRFFISLAEDTFRDPSIILWIVDCLRELDVRGNWLTLQFQEATVEGNLEILSKLVDALRQIKCRVAINRFGETERSAEILGNLPVDIVVMMPENTRGLADDRGKQQRLNELATLAREKKVRSVVPGVEDARTLTVLWNAGVDYVQGNFLQRPTPTLEAQG